MLLLALFIGVPLIEIALFVQLGSILDLGWILLIVVLTAILGTWIVRRQGRDVLRQIQGAFEQMRDPTEPIAHGAMVLFSGALLLTPGFFTDTVGFLLLIPAFRSVVFRWLRTRIMNSGGIQGHVHMRANVRSSYGEASSRPKRRPDSAVIDGEFTEITEPDERRSDGPSGWTKPE